MIWWGKNKVTSEREHAGATRSLCLGAQTKPLANCRTTYMYLRYHCMRDYSVALSWALAIPLV